MSTTTSTRAGAMWPRHALQSLLGSVLRGDADHEFGCTDLLTDASVEHPAIDAVLRLEDVVDGAVVRRAHRSGPPTRGRSDEAPR